MGSETAIERVQELFDFLQGVVPDGYEIESSCIPRLSPDQAWTAVWYLANLYWQIPDHIERCGECGDLYNTEAEGGYTEEEPSRHFCDECWDQRLSLQEAAEGGDDAPS